MANGERFYLQPLKHLSDGLDRLVEGRLWLKVLIGLGLGIVAGVLLGPELGLVSERLVVIITAWLALPGQLFLALIQMIVVPLVVASVVRGLAANDAGTAKNRADGGGVYHDCHRCGLRHRYWSGRMAAAGLLHRRHCFES